MHNADLILTLTAGLGIALLCALIALRMRLPAIVGYLLAGMIVGPHTPGFVANRALAEQLAEVGVILLMFGVGLDFHFKDLVATRRIAVTGALAQIAVATGLGALAGHWLGWSWTASLVFGLSLSVASTVVLTRVLADHGDLHSQTGRIAIGWLVVEDIFTVFALVILPVLLAPGKETVSLPVAFGITTLKLAAFVGVMYVLGRRLIPKLLSAAAATHSRELFTLTALALALGIAVGAALLFGVSMALGAFLAGMVVGQSEFSHRAASEALPMRDAFAVLFFVSVGMLLDPTHVVRAPLDVVVTTLIVIAAKPLAAFLAVIVLGYGAHIGVRVAVALAQIGEFSFILAALGNQFRILPESATQSLVAASIVSITLNPILYRMTPAMEKRLRGVSLFRRRVPLGPQPRDHDSRSSVLHRAVIVGYGPVGRAVTSLLEHRGIDATIVELNIETVRQLRSDGKRAIYGDATQSEILKEAGVGGARSLVITSPVSADSAAMIHAAREINPSIKVLARSAYLSESSALRESGAGGVFSSEAEVAMAMTQHILADLGTTPEQMDLERERVREEMYGSHPQGAL